MKKVISITATTSIVELNGTKYAINTNESGIDHSGHGRSPMQIAIDCFMDADGVITVKEGYTNKHTSYFYKNRRDKNLPSKRMLVDCIRIENEYLDLTK